jgi:hypothetical protein
MNVKNAKNVTSVSVYKLNIHIHISKITFGDWLYVTIIM